MRRFLVIPLFLGLLPGLVVAAVPVGVTDSIDELLLDAGEVALAMVLVIASILVYRYIRKAFIAGRMG